MINNFTIEEVRVFWDDIAQIYEPSNSQVGYVHTQRFEKTLEFGDIKSGQKILNIWSRTGGLIPWLRKTDHLDITNREVSPRMLDIAKTKYPEEDFQLTDLEHLSEFPDETFDRIISLETLEHVPKPERFLQELQRVLKNDGRLILSLPPKGAEIPEYIYKLFLHDHGEGPHRFLWPYEVKRLLKLANLELVGHFPFIILPLGSDAITRAGERILTFLFGWTPLANFGVRHFYICKKLPAQN